MDNSHSHVVPVARPVYFILRIVQLVFAVVVLGLLAYLGYLYNNSWANGYSSTYSGAVGVGIFSV